MSPPTNDRHMNLEYMPTGIPALDQILVGGLLRGGMYIIDGVPGTGKTVLANQISFNQAAKKGRALFVTLLAESHTRMLQHLQSMSFFDENAMPDHVYYVSAIQVLATDGLRGLVDLLRREMKRHQPDVLVIDGFSITHEAATSLQEFKRFVQDVQGHASAAGCVVIVLTSDAASIQGPEFTMVDGVIQLDHVLHERRTERTLQVLKFRGSSFLPGAHSFRISGDGILIFPRIEAVYETPSEPDEYQLQRQSTGVRGIDEMLEGGLLASTTNGLFGPTGIGKTTFCLQFLSLSTEEEPGLLFSSFERPERLRVKADAMGIDLRGLEQRGHVQVIWRPQGEQLLDELGHEIIEVIRRRRVKRVAIDGYGGLIESAINSERITRFVSALSNEMRALGATAVVCIESRSIIGSSMELPSKGLSSLLEGLILMRYAEMGGQLHRLISITKIRDSNFDPFLRDFTIDSKGIQVGGTFTGVEAVLSGFAREQKANLETKPPQG